MWPCIAGLKNTEDVLIGLDSEKCGISLPSHVLKASSKAMAIEEDGDNLRMVLMKLHDAAGDPKKRRICRRFVITRE